MSKNGSEELRLSDLATFLAVKRHLSLAAAAREVGVTTSQVSKAVSRLERQLEAKLLTRTSKGVGLTDAATRLLPQLERVLSSVDELRVSVDGPTERVLTMAAPSYLAAECVGPMVQALTNTRLRTVQLAPAQIAALAADQTFEMALTMGQPRLPRTWQVEDVGEIALGLFASPSLVDRLGRGLLTEEMLRGLPFISPAGLVNSQWVSLDDGCPMGASGRRRGHECDTVAVAMELACRTEQLVFGPAIAARRFLTSGALVALEVEGWSVRQRLTLCTNIDRVNANDQRRLNAALKALLM